MNKFKCPNCKKEMILEKINITYNQDKYDKWTCEDCVHIVLLDGRFE